jgi:carbon monoxide dehydrogenase subunit G
MELSNEFTVNADIDTTWATLTDVEKIAPCMPGAQLTEIEGDTYRGTVAVKVGPITAKFKGEANFVEQDVAAHKAVLKASGRDTGGKGNAAALITAQLTPVSDASTHVLVTTDLTITGKVAQFGRGALADVSTKLIDQFVEQLETTVLNGAPAPTAEAPEPAATPAPEETPAPKPRAKKAPAKTAEVAPSPSSAQDAPGADDAADDGGIDTAAIVELAERAMEHAPTEHAPNGTPTVRRIEGPEARPIDLLDTAGAAMLKRLLPFGIVAVLLFFLIRRRGGSAD